MYTLLFREVLAMWFYCDYQFGGIAVLDIFQCTSIFQVKAQQANIQLSHSLPTIIHVGNYLQAHARGTLEYSN